MRHSFISYPKSYAVSLNMRHSYTSLPKGYAVSLNHCIALGCDVNECLMFRDTAYPLAVI
jgi:hypothetical protein